MYEQRLVPNMTILHVQLHHQLSFLSLDSRLLMVVQDHIYHQKNTYLLPLLMNVISYLQPTSSKEALSFASSFIAIYNLQNLCNFASLFSLLIIVT